MRRSLAFVLFSALVLATSSAHALGTGGASLRSAGRLGIGLGNGWASGLSGKLGLADRLAVQLTAGTYGLGHGAGDGFSVGADLLVEMPALWRHPAVELAWSVGAGGGLALVDGGDPGIGAQGVLGLEFLFVPAPIDIVLELRPRLLVSPVSDFEPFDFGGHVRFYF